MWSEETLQLIEAACNEDLGADGDITSALTAGPNPCVVGNIVVRQPGVICGLALGRAICNVFAQRLGQPLAFEPSLAPSGAEYADGAAVDWKTRVAGVRGPQSAVLTVERTLLNFLGRMSGVATLTQRFVNAARNANPHVEILDTRKTLPGWRELDKYAVRMGGGRNHRFGLYDAVLIKDNHIAGIPTPQLAPILTKLLSPVPRAARSGPAPSFVEVEVDSLAQFVEICKVERVDIILLDNFSPADMRAAVAHRDARGLRGRLALEASGGVTLARVAEIAATGVDRISVGALTHSATALDVALDL